MDDLSERILKHLRFKKTEATNKIVNALRVPKKTLNNALYKLERQRLIVKQQDSPPIWGLPEFASSPKSPSCNTPGRMTRKRKAKEMEQVENNDNKSTEMSSKILKYLESKKAARPFEIAKAVGVTRSTINPFLYALQEKGQVMKNSGKSLTWSLSKNIDPIVKSFDAESQVSTSGQQFIQSSGDFPLFQDTQLFRTDISLDMDATELLSGEDCELDLNEQLGAGYENNGPSIKQETDFEQETEGLSNQNPVNNMEHEKTEEFDIENSGYNEHEDNMIVEVNDEENDVSDEENVSKDILKFDSYENNEYEMLQMMGNKSEADVEMLNSDSGDSNNGVLSKVEAVVDVRLVKNVTDLDYSLQGSTSPVIPILKMGDGQLCTSELPVLCTPDLSELKNEDESYSDHLTSQQSSVSPPSTPNIVNEALELEEADVADEDFIESIENDKDEKSDMKALDYDMAHCDKILQVLSTLPGCAEFVLVNRTKLEKMDMDTALVKCQELGFVSGCSKLWRITPDGIDYIEDKLGTGEKDTPVVNVGQPVQTKKFSGPPPSPMALLKGKAGLVRGSQQIQLSQPHVSNNRDRSPLNRNSFQPSVSNSQVRVPTVRNNVAINSLSVSEGSVKSALNQSLFPAHNSAHSSDMSERSSVASGLWDKSSQQIKSPPSSLYQSKSLQAGSISQSSFKQPKAPIQSQTFKHTDIPSKYSNYPNKATSTQVLRNLNSKSSGPSRDNKQVSSKPSIPPSPMEILSKNLKKTEISPPNTPPSSTNTNNPMLASSHQSFHNSFSQQRQLGGNHTSQSLMLGQFGKQSLVTSNTSRMLGQFGNQSSISSNKSLMSGQLGNQPVKSSTPSLMSGQFGSQPMSLQVNQNQSRTVQPNGTDFKSLPINKISGNANSGLNSLALSNESFNALNKNAVSALMEYAQSRKMEARVQVIGQRGPPHRPTFTMAAFVGNRQFSPVTCTNKKDGRKEACDIAMRQLVAEGQFQAETASEAAGSKPQASIETMTHFDKIAALTHRGFTALVSQITAESFAGRKVIAGLVMKRSDDDTGVLISLGTEDHGKSDQHHGKIMEISWNFVEEGNRCITGQQLSLQGNTVNDSHAEIITRRGFMRFLYKQLLDYDPAKTNPLFERSRTGKLQIRPKITFHLYISTAPCGDGALFSPRDAESTKTPVDSRIRPPHEPVFSSNVQGLLRTKVEGGEGTIPIEPGFKGQTFDGIQRGERLRTMSCTDKVCRWNVVGMQGALLSHFIEPVYLDSLTLGLLYDHGHLSRAVCCRVGRGPTNIDDLLPTNYRLNHPWLGRVTTCDPPREVQKTKAVSVNWSFGDSAAEVTDGTLGLCNTSIEKGMFSRCSKRNLYNSFKAVCNKFGRQDLLTAENYKDAKMMASDFQQACEAMLCKFKENKFGPWVSKPVEEEMFSWEET